MRGTIEIFITNEQGFNFSEEQIIKMKAILNHLDKYPEREELYKKGLFRVSIRKCNGGEKKYAMVQSLERLKFANSISSGNRGKFKDANRFDEDDTRKKIKKDETKELLERLDYLHMQNLTNETISEINAINIRLSQIEEQQKKKYNNLLITKYKGFFE